MDYKKGFNNTWLYDAINYNLGQYKEVKCAILRAVFYVINTNDKISDNGEKIFINLALSYDKDPSIIDYALKTMSDDDMLNLLQFVPDNDLITTLFDAAKVDGEVSDEKRNTIFNILFSIPKNKKELEKYKTLLRQFNIF